MLLLDENISYKVSKLISDFFPNVIHVRNIGLNNSSDYEIWDYAKSENLAIVTFDNDFLNISVLKGCPPKVILLKFGNRSTQDLVNSILFNQEIIIEFLTKSELKDLGCLEIK